MQHLIGCTERPGFLALIVFTLIAAAIGGSAIGWRMRLRAERRGRLPRQQPESSPPQAVTAARFDALTGLANRHHTEQLLNNAIALSQRAGLKLALTCVDLDQFELLEEVLGLNLAEQIIIAAARRLQSLVRETDTVGHIGRDAFVIIQPLAGRPEDAAALADRIIAEMALPYTAGHRNLVVTASAGVAVHPGDGTNARKLIRKAQEAMRRAKTDGRNRWRFVDSDADQRLEEQRALELDLRVALVENQFFLEYQPFCDAASLEVVGYEALLRWNHPTRGRVSPADFIPRAEACGLIVPIGSWVLATACAEAATWHSPLTVAVNLSPVQFGQPGIVCTVEDVLRQSGLPAERLELEITETTLMQDAGIALNLLTPLKALGVRIAMDDFGTGYSSLSYLRKFPFDKIKIDRSFISDVHDAVEAEAIVRAIVAMGRSLRLDVTAEGVETRRQLSMLQALGCNMVQGYLLGRPGPRDSIRNPRLEMSDSGCETVPAMDPEIRRLPVRSDT